MAAEVTGNVRDLCSNPSFQCCALNTHFVTQLSSLTMTSLPCRSCATVEALDQRALWLLDNHDTHSTRWRSRPKNTNGAEIHSADIKAVEEIRFSDCLMKPDKRHLACAAFWGWGTSCPLFMAPVRLLLPRSLAGTNVNLGAHRCPVAMPENRRHSVSAED